MAFQPLMVRRLRQQQVGMKTTKDRAAPKRKHRRYSPRCLPLSTSLTRRASVVGAVTCQQRLSARYLESSQQNRTDERARGAQRQHVQVHGKVQWSSSLSVDHGLRLAGFSQRRNRNYPVGPADTQGRSSIFVK